MKKIDLHIHTSPAIYEDRFNFSIDKLKEYVNNNKLDIIAITNHNHFNKKQFLEIAKAVDILVLPGIEIDIEKSHLLLIDSDENLDDFESKCNKVEELINNDCNASITFEQFKNIFINYKKYIAIPHYKKHPIMQASVINKFGEIIVCGEVRSAKQFEIVKKDENSLVPVLFSDIRIKENLEEFSTRNTYIDVSECSFNTLKFTLSDKNKVFINGQKKDGEFEIAEDGTLASTNLNVIMGKRSSGKTFTLDRIYNLRDKKDIKYIKQFSLTGNSEKNKFEELVQNEQTTLIEEYLKPLKELTDKLLNNENSYDTKIDLYLESLKEYANSLSLNDVYSKTKMFNENLYNAKEDKDTKKLISYVLELLDSKDNKSLVEEKIGTYRLILLLQALVLKRQEELLAIKLKDECDFIIRFIKSKLKNKSSMPLIEDIDIYSLFKDKVMISKYNSLIKYLKNRTIINTLDVYGFKTEFCKKEYKNATDVKETIKDNVSLVEAYKEYDNAYAYINALKRSGLDNGKIYKCLIKLELVVKNNRNVELSGGERAEYNLLHELKDATNFDILLIDEPEASFDNLFIKEKIIDIIKDISKKTTVFVTTHNNTLGVLLKPNKIIYTVVESDNKYKIYTCDFGSKYFADTKGNRIDSFKSIMDTMEAGEEAYKERKSIYEDIEN